MVELDRRRFLNQTTGTTLGVASGLTILGDARSARAQPANDKIVLAVVGCGGRGSVLARNFAARQDCEVAYLCDVDQKMIERNAGRVADEQGGREPKGVSDFRRVLDDKSVDALVVATPTHWHALATVWGCQAEKHVYVEKPLCHNAWEGQQMVKAARRHDRIVQVGTQNRSGPYNLAARKYIADGKLGKIHFVRVLNQKSWPNFEMEPNQAVPAGLDWDMWNGPAPQHAYNSTLRSNWQHFWRYCIGDLGNDGAHQFDLARMIVGFDLPSQVYCTGGRFNSTGAADTPDTQLATFKYDNDLVVNLELTLYTPYMLKIDPVVRETDRFPYWPQVATRIDIYGDRGVMCVGRMGGGWQVFVRTKDRQPVIRDEMYGRFPDPPHQEDFVRSIREHRRPNADIEIGQRSHLTLQYATMSYRAGGRTLNVDPETQQVDDADAMQYFSRSEMRKPWVLEEVV